MKMWIIFECNEGSMGSWLTFIHWCHNFTVFMSGKADRDFVHRVQLLSQTLSSFTHFSFGPTEWKIRSFTGCWCSICKEEHSTFAYLWLWQHWKWGWEEKNCECRIFSAVILFIQALIGAQQCQTVRSFQKKEKMGWMGQKLLKAPQGCARYSRGNMNYTYRWRV